MSQRGMNLGLFLQSVHRSEKRDAARCAQQICLGLLRNLGQPELWQAGRIDREL